MNLPESFSQAPSLFFVIYSIFIPGGKDCLFGSDNIDCLQILPHDGLQLFYHLSNDHQAVLVSLLSYLSLLCLLATTRTTFCFRNPVISIVPCFALLISISIRIVEDKLKVPSSPFKLTSMTLKESQLPLNPQPSFSSRSTWVINYLSSRRIHS